MDIDKNCTRNRLKCVCKPKPQQISVNKILIAFDGLLFFRNHAIETEILITFYLPQEVEITLKTYESHVGAANKE